MNKLTLTKFCNKSYIMIVLVNALAFLNFNMSTVGMPVYAAMIGGNGLSTGMVTTIAATSALVCRPFMGFMSNKKNVYKMVFLGLIFMSLAPAFLFFCKSIVVLYLVRCVQGIGWGITSTACSNIITMKSPISNISEGIGYAGAISSIATAIAPSISVYLFEKYGIIVMLLSIAMSTMFALIIMCLANFKSDSQKNYDRNMKFMFMDCLDGSAVIPAFFVFIITFCYSPMVTFITQYSMSNGLSDIYLYYICYATTTIISRPIAGKYVDKFGFFLLGLIALSSMFFSTGLLLVTNNMIVLCCSGLVAGIGTGVGINTFQTMAVLNNKSNNKGKAIATFLFGFDLGMAIGAGMAGFYVGIVGLRNMYGIFCLFSLCGIFMFVLLFRIKKDIMKLSRNKG